MSSRRILLASVFALCGLLAPTAARADSIDLGGFRLSSPVLVAHASDRRAVITVTRSDTLLPAQVRYGDSHLTAVPYQDYTPTGGRLDFDAGQASASFTIPLVDHGVAGPPRTLSVYLYGASPIGLGVPSTALLTILQDSAAPIVKLPGNPLGLAQVAANGNPLAGATFYVDHTWGLASLAARQLRRSAPKAAAMLGVIANQPETHRFGAWDGSDPSVTVARYLERAASEQPGTVPLIATYRLVHGPCGHYSDSPAQERSYDAWMDGFARGISTYRAVVFLEMDSLITAGCLSRHGVEVRMRELRYATLRLSQLPRTAVYLDAGAADALPAPYMARLLRRAGIGNIQGFFLNSTHFDWTSSEIRFGKQISRLTGGKHFIVSTAANGRGPLVPRDRVHQGNEVLCNPPGRGLGPKPTTNTGYPRVDAFVWIGNPGRSGGACGNGAPGTGVFWTQYALSLVKNAVFSVP
jgi:endoglucanase